MYLFYTNVREYKRFSSLFLTKCRKTSKTQNPLILTEKLNTFFEIIFIILQVIAPQFKHFQKLRDFIEMKLPPGFPVKVDIPVLPTVSARVTFHDFEWRNEGNVLPDSSFNIPEGYVEDPSRFPDL